MQFDVAAYPAHWTRDLFAAHTLIEVHAAELAPPLLERAARLFPRSSVVLALTAQAKYAMRGAPRPACVRVCVCVCGGGGGLRGMRLDGLRAPRPAEFVEAEAVFARIREGDRMRVDQARGRGGCGQGGGRATL